MRRSRSRSAKAGSDAESVSAYLAACEKTKASPDPAVVSVLQTGYSTLTLSPRLSGPGCLLPLLATLPDAPHVQTLRIVPDRKCQMHRNHSAAGDVDAWVLSKILRACQQITELHLEDCHFSLPAFAELSSAIGESEVLTKLTIQRCCLCDDGCAVLADALRGNTSIVDLDASYNWLGGRAAVALSAALRAGAAEDAVLRFEARGNAWFQEILNSVTHGLGAFLSIVGSIVLLHHAAADNQKFWACLIYCFSLVTLYTASTLYHAFFMLASVCVRGGGEGGV